MHPYPHCLLFVVEDDLALGRVDLPLEESAAGQHILRPLGGGTHGSAAVHHKQQAERRGLGHGFHEGNTAAQALKGFSGEGTQEEAAPLDLGCLQF